LSNGRAIHQEGDDLALGDHLQAIGGIGSAMDGSIAVNGMKKSLETYCLIFLFMLASYCCIMLFV
jgi:hypothetical protein